MNACIYYHPEAYTTSGPRLMGRNAAGESFLRGYLAHATASEFWIQTEQQEHADDFIEKVAQAGRFEPVRVVEKQTLGSSQQPDLVYFPGPGIGPHAFNRAAYGHGAWSLTGITHTTSSARVMDSLVELVTAPVQPWDAVICTSVAVRDNVQRVIQSQVDHLQERLGITRFVLPRFPVIPLGINTKEFVFTDSQRAAARRALGVDGETLVVLFMGRLSFHAKAHPLAMYQALEAAAQRTGKQVLLVECGWHANEFIEKAYMDAAAAVCPTIRVATLDGRKPEDRLTAWAGADIFCSLSDNIQETFGITPIEAMAAGLPVVVSDWDGYRDTVRDQVDGFRIPTLMAGPGLGSDLALRHALEIDTYDAYCGLTCSLVAVDVPATTDAFARLFESSGLRRRLGKSGRARARKLFDWASIIPRYEALWSELSEIRRARSGELTPRSRLWPARLDPFDIFAGYPTTQLAPETRLRLVDADAATALQRTLEYQKLAMVDFAKEIMPSEEELGAVLEKAAEGPCLAAMLMGPIPTDRRLSVFRSIAWLVKLNILAVVREENG